MNRIKNDEKKNVNRLNIWNDNDFCVFVPRFVNKINKYLFKMIKQFFFLNFCAMNMIRERNFKLNRCTKRIFHSFWYFYVLLTNLSKFLGFVCTHSINEIIIKLFLKLILDFVALYRVLYDII